jgi:hypothetical protein
MTRQAAESFEREYDFALIVADAGDLDERVENALFEAGCDDATLSIQYGLLYMEFSRAAKTLKDAIISAIRDVHRSGLHLQVLRVDKCNLVTASDIARRIDRSRQLVHQYMTGQRGPGGFPPPYCHLAAHAPLWAWCAVSHWLVENNLIRPEESWNAEVVEAVNTVLERQQHQHRHYPKLVDEIALELQSAKP